MHKAALYQRSNGLQRRDAKQVIDEFSPLFQWRLDGQDSLLDIGCGSGDVTIDYILPMLPNKFKKLVGTDLSEQMIDYARNMYQHPKITFEIIDIGENDLLNIFNDNNNNNINNNNNNNNKLDKEHENCVENIQHKTNNNQNQNQNNNNNIKSNIINNNKSNYNIINKYNQYFDHVTSFYCLHWVRNQLQAIKNIYNFLNSGGDCLLVFLANNPIFVIYEQLSKYKKWENYMKDVHKYLSPYQYSDNPANEFANILSLAGFSEYTVEVRDKLFIYEGLDVLKKSVKAVNPFLDRIPYDLHDEFLDDYINIVTKMKLTQTDVDRDDLRFLTPYKLIIAYARK